MKPSSKISGGQIEHQSPNLTTRYIGHLSNATFREDLRENVAEVDEERKKDTSERALNYFKQVFTKTKTKKPSTP